MDSEKTPSRPAPRKLASLGDMVGDVLTPSPTPGRLFGLADLDAATGGLQPGRLTLLAAAPGTGGSLLALAAARHTALTEGSPVLYAAAGLTTDVVTRWIIAAEAGVDLRRLRAGTLTTPDREAAEKAGARLSQQARLFFDDGDGLTAQAIAETAPYVDGLALVVVDRLHQSADPHIPLSGDQVPPAVRTLTQLARQLSVPVLAVLNTDDAKTVRSLDAEVTLTLAAADDSGIANVTVAERDFGQTTIRLRADLDHARFTDAPALPAPAVPTAPNAGDTTPPAADTLTAAEQELAEAALPFTSGAVRGLPAETLQLLADHREAVLKGQMQDQPEVRAYTAALATAAGLILPDTSQGQRLRAALEAFATAHRAKSATAVVAAQAAEAQTDQDAPADALSTEADHGDPVAADQSPPAGEEEQAAASEEQELQPGDEDDEPEGAVFPGLRLLKDAIGRSKMHPIMVIRKDERDAAPWTLFNEVMDGEPRWVHPEVESVRTRGGKRRQLIVPDEFGPGQFCTIDRNGSYPSACSAVTLAPNKLLHTGPLEQRAKDQAGVFQIDLPAWDHSTMPHPLGRLADRGDEHGRIWVTTPHMELLEKLTRQEQIAEPLRIHDSWTGRANNSLLKPFYQAAKQARTELIEAGGEPYIEYKRRLSIALRLLWPKGERLNSPFWRPDWRLSMVAEASVRHWVKAWGAVQDGHTLIALRNVDEAVFWTLDGTAPATYKVGTGFGEVKVKVEQGSED
ncbi:DnaB helicase C-terminal domain-containing protein [Streptomyces sp. NBC_01381]|uniref:DnaB-like helicase C-terminal domain-containing protein n=1 Tax=Streptomyces sp. NBC_01381 TaxID=2903845 RepID=UPI00224E964F|nr:DnaB-like helicase C-terminal domain-containing protein [Streptomyces sp. NBC_01381]MCX4673550.1 DnaB helicase C-terminal domain-containing protein [Streptomyces sp. NBC_01381]